MTHEDGFALEPVVRGEPLVHTNKVARPLEIEGLAAFRRGEMRRFLGLDARKRYRLEIRAVISPWLQPGEHELRSDVFSSQLPAAPSRPASLEQIARQKPHVCADAVA